MQFDIKGLEQKKAAKVAELNASIALTEKEDRVPTAEEKQKRADLEGGIADLNARMVSVRAAMDRERGGVTAADRAANPAAEDGRGGFKSFGQFLQAVICANSPASVSDRLMRINPSLRGAMEFFAGTPSGGSEGVPSDGGILVPPDFSGELLKESYEVGQLARRVRRIPVSGNRLTIPGVDESSRATGSRWGGVQVYRGGEADTATAKKPKFRDINLVLKKLIGIAYATDELLEDVTAMEAIYRQAFTEEIAWVIDNEIYRGSGAGQMLGILSAPCLVSISKETGQAAKSIVVENLVNMYARMPARLLGGAEWFLNIDAFPTLLTSGVIVGLGGSPAFLSGGLAPAPTGTILGRPVNFIEQASTVGTVGDIVLANFGQYLMAEKAGGGVNWQSSVHVRFIYDEMTFRITVRNDGQPSWDVAVTPANGTNKQSPFVALATRA